MARKKKQHGIIEGVHIIDIADDGMAVGKHEDMIIFVKRAVPGDIANVQITRSRRNYKEGYTVSLQQESEHREKAFCKHFGVCGGCKWQHLKYDIQLEFKQKQIENQLTRIGGLNLPNCDAIIPSEKIIEYRNKLEYTFSARRWFEEGEPMYDENSPEAKALGFHVPAMFDKVVNIEKCYLQDDLGNNIRNFIKDFAIEKNFSFYNIKTQVGYLRNLILRNNLNGKFMLILSVAEDRLEETAEILEEVSKRFPEIKSLYIAYNPSKNDSLNNAKMIHFKGDKYLIETMEDLKFAISPKSFFQTNSLQAYELYKKVREFANPKPSDIIYDLYTGTGTIALFVSALCKKVIGVEFVKEAIKDAKYNTKLNKKDNLEFFVGDAAKIFTKEFTAKHGKPDIVICDPPRAGMHPDVVNTLLELKPQKIVYVSCNAATQARDMKTLQEAYNIVKLQAFDMFPHTQHIENVALLELNAEK
ncbi:MAG: 23S rRNA (uracil(1939)-C(5))-methyltransferase RlmD [Bacteroidales bacterium]|nr:23S rRNA (uracil(1939)-C(5))-methyltransferase RlmD [Bacteroidales bacterium]